MSYYLSIAVVDIQQQAIRLRQTAGSPHSSTGSRISPHPVSLAKALERSSNQSVNSDCNDSCSCTGDSGFDEYPPSSMPMSTSWHKSGPPTKPKPTKPLKQNSDPQLSYVNVGIISPTSPPPQPHTTISTLAPTYTTHTSTTPSPPTPSHTSVSPMGPMYNCISIEEQEPGTCLAQNRLHACYLNRMVCTIIVLYCRGVPVVTS